MSTDEFMVRNDSCFSDFSGEKEGEREREREREIGYGVTNHQK